MPSVAALAKRRGLAYERLNVASTKLQEQYGASFPRIHSTAKDAELRRVEEVEQIAALLEAVAELKLESKAGVVKSTSKKKEHSND